MQGILYTIKLSAYAFLMEQIFYLHPKLMIYTANSSSPVRVSLITWQTHICIADCFVITFLNYFQKQSKIRISNVSMNLGPSNGFTSRFLGFSLYISNTTNKSDGTLCFKDASFTLNTIPAAFNTTCTVHGQYVIYYNERISNVTYPDGYSRYAYNELCEVEVYGKYVHRLSLFELLIGGLSCAFDYLWYLYFDYLIT